MGGNDNYQQKTKTKNLLNTLLVPRVWKLYFFSLEFGK
jgi:hypothetical protein